MSLDIDQSFEDEGYEDSVGSASYASSIATHIREGIEENGRKYAAYGKETYYMPIDEQEQDRNDLQHAKFTLLIGDKLHVAPIKDPLNILDLGTGSGIWAIGAADQYESARVIGVDIAAVQPQWVPQNCSFELLDIEDDWLFSHSSFDFIHARELIFCIRDWDALFKRVFEHLKPGGYFEVAGSYPVVQSDDNTVQPDCFLIEMANIFHELGEAMGTPLNTPPLWKSKMEAIGFVNVQERLFKIPQGPWAKNKTLKRIGAFENHSLVAGLDAYLMRGYTQLLKGDPDKLKILMAETIRDLRNPRIHSYIYYYDVVGQKPL